MISNKIIFSYFSNAVMSPRETDVVIYYLDVEEIFDRLDQPFSVYKNIFIEKYGACKI